MKIDSKERFSNRVNDYRKYRPDYPAGLIDVIKEICRLKYREYGRGYRFRHRNYDRAIAPALPVGVCCRTEAKKCEMRQKEQFHNNPKFVSVNGSAEETTLSSTRIDLIISAQAFHWFDRSLSKREFKRILKPNGWVVLVWNTRVIDGDSFHIELEEFLRRETPEYGKIHHKNIDRKTLCEFFSQKEIVSKTLPNHQILDWEGMKGRFLSASYIPAPGQPGHEFIVDGLKKIFLKHQSNGTVTLKYVTEMYASRFGPT